jgi:hypothetical protein
MILKAHLNKPLKEYSQTKSAYWIQKMKIFLVIERVSDL